MDELDEFRSARDIHALLARRGEDIGLATVYRTLQAMAEAGECDVLRTDAGDASVYRRCARREHHHHLMCRRCGRTVEIAAAEVEAWASRTAAESGFTELQHSVELFGTCGDCRAADAGEPGPVAGARVPEPRRV
jgi:Fur family ferric uptake transcriptional regulator